MPNDDRIDRIPLVDRDSVDKIRYELEAAIEQHNKSYEYLVQHNAALENDVKVGRGVIGSQTNKINHMREQISELKLQLESSLNIQRAEKEILIAEIGHNAAMKSRIDELMNWRQLYESTVMLRQMIVVG